MIPEPITPIGVNHATAIVSLLETKKRFARLNDIKVVRFADNFPQRPLDQESQMPNAEK